MLLPSRISGARGAITLAHWKLRQQPSGGGGGGGSVKPLRNAVSQLILPQRRRSLAEQPKVMDENWGT